MKNLYWSSINKVQQVKGNLRARALAKTTGGSEMVAVVVLIVLAIGLGTIFKDELSDLFQNTIMPEIETEIRGIF